MIYMGSQESLAEICHEYCDRIQKHGPSLIFFYPSLVLMVNYSVFADKG